MKVKNYSVNYDSRKFWLCIPTLTLNKLYTFTRSAIGIIVKLKILIPNAFFVSITNIIDL